MKSKLLTILFIFQAVIAFCQKPDYKLVSDTTIALGVIKEGTYLGKAHSSYNSYYDKRLDKFTVVVLCGAKKGSSDYKAYEVVYNGKPYFVDVNNVETNPLNFEAFLNMDEEQYAKVRKASIDMGKYAHSDKIDKALKWLETTKPYGIALYKYSAYDESEYTDGTGMEFEIINTGKKTIKYVTFNFTGYNAVDDKVSTMKTRKGIGPIKPEASGAYTFEYVWMSDIVEYSKINSIKLQFMDGTFKTITNIQAIKIPSEYKELLEESVN